MNERTPWRRERGSYLLLLDLKESTRIKAGALASSIFPCGRYVYAGSALGSGGVAGRVERHLSRNKRTHWHIDYLAAIAPVIGVAAVYTANRQECRWVRALTTLAGATAPVTGFGSSDCRSGCPAHLVRLPDALPLSWIENELTRCPIQAI